MTTRLADLTDAALLSRLGPQYNSLLERHTMNVRAAGLYPLDHRGETYRLPTRTDLAAMLLAATEAEAVDLERQIAEREAYCQAQREWYDDPAHDPVAILERARRDEIQRDLDYRRSPEGHRELSLGVLEEIRDLLRAQAERR